MFCTIRVVIFTLFLSSSAVSLADVSLSVEDLITDKGKIILELSLSYANSSQEGLQTGGKMIVQTGGTSFVGIPVKIGEFSGTRDALVGTLGLRYGLTRKLEIYSRGSYLYNNNRSVDLFGVMSSDSDEQFSDAWLGVNYQISEDTDTPALLTFVEFAAIEKHLISESAWKSWMLGFTSYHAIDPVVLSITGAYRGHQERTDGHMLYKPGNFILLSPAVAFAVNDRVTFSSGIQWTNQQSDSYENITQGIRQTSIDITLGLAYGVGNGNTIDFSFKANASGRGGADMRLKWLYAI